MQCIALYCWAHTWGHGRLTESQALWWYRHYQPHVWVSLSDTLKWIGWCMGCPGAVLQLSPPLLPRCCSRDKLSAYAPHCFHQLLLTSGSWTGFSHEQLPFRGAEISSSCSRISPDISTTPFTEASLLPLAVNAANTRHLRMTAGSRWLCSKPLILTSLTNEAWLHVWAHKWFVCCCRLTPAVCFILLPTCPQLQQTVAQQLCHGSIKKTSRHCWVSIFFWMFGNQKKEGK